MFRMSVLLHVMFDIFRCFIFLRRFCELFICLHFNTRFFSDKFCPMYVRGCTISKWERAHTMTLSPISLYGGSGTTRWWIWFLMVGARCRPTTAVRAVDLSPPGDVVSCFRFSLVVDCTFRESNAFCCAQAGIFDTATELLHQ